MFNLPVKSGDLQDALQISFKFATRCRYNRDVQISGGLDILLKLVTFLTITLFLKLLHLKHGQRCHV